jgi:glycosyltransferase involved in cell wall biosynthesis
VPRKGGEKRQFSLLHLITTLDVGGAEMSLLNLISRMDGTRFKNHVICLAEMGPLGEKISACGIPVNALNMPRGRLTVGGLVKLFGLIRQINPDILQTWMYHADLIGLLFGRIFRVRPICWNIRCSNMDLVKYRWATVITVKLCAILSSLPNVIIANSREGANFHERIGYRGKRWEVIPNGFDLRVFQPDGQAKERLAMELGLDPKDLPVFIGYIARFDPMKDHQTFLDAASPLLVGRRDVHFVLAGRNVDQDNREISDRVPKALEEHFHLLGERDDAEKITAGLDVACSVSLGEGFSNVSARPWLVGCRVLSQMSAILRLSSARPGLLCSPGIGKGFCLPGGTCSIWEGMGELNWERLRGEESKSTSTSQKLLGDMKIFTLL